MNVRIVAGTYGGRVLDAPGRSSTHAMSERGRNALFNSISSEIRGAEVLDAFAGSGSLGLESISRGATSAIGVELDKTAYVSSSESIEKLGIAERAHIVKASVKAWSTRHQHDQFDLIFVDPPYDDIPYKDVESLPRHLRETGVLVLSWPPKVRLPIFNELTVVQSKEYGDSQLVFYKRNIA